jgi:hypothetical protein
MQNRLIIISFTLIFTFASVAEGQKQINSPYSRFNIGTLDPSGSFRSLAMGGTGVAMRDNNSVYYGNPASYSSLDTTSFLFDFGIDYSIIDLSEGKNKYRSDDMNFDHLLMGFPLAKGWGVAAGLVPFSNGYYDLSETLKSGDPGYDPLTGEITSTHKGDGGLTSFFIGTGINVIRNLSAGVNLTVLFGELDRVNQFEFGDLANTFGQYNSEKLKINGINLDYGLQYSISFKKNYFITAGISFTAAKKYRSDFTRISERFAAYQASGYSPDTLFYTNGSSGDSTKLPATIKLGVTFGKKDKFVVGVDYINTNWASAKIQGSSGYLANSKSWLIGAELVPDKLSNSSYLARMEYRIGGHISNNYLLINGEQIKEYGASCGIGLRLKNYFSKVNVFFDFTKKNGNLAKGLHNENFYTMGISLNLYDNWFMKKRFE